MNFHRSLDRMLQKQGPGMAYRSVSILNHRIGSSAHLPWEFRESNLDDVLQIENVFMNVSKGEVAKAGDLQKAFGTTETSGIVKEVCLLVL
jgi:ribosome maturation protein SDO1